MDPDQPTADPIPEMADEETAAASPPPAEEATAGSTENKDAATSEAKSEQNPTDETPQPAEELTKLHSQGVSNESENESEELDDIELIFTTEETCRETVGLQEDLVSITDNDNWQQHQQPPRTPTLVSFFFFLIFFFPWKLWMLLI